MSKRKSRSKSLFVDKDDMVFLDDSDSEIAAKIMHSNQSSKQDGKKSDDNSNVRISSRAKKQKNIYDPSEHNGPVHKKKREALEAAQLLAETKKKVPSPVKVNKTPTKTPSKSPIKVHKVLGVKSALAIVSTVNDVKKKLILDKPAEETAKPESIELKITNPSTQAVSLPIKEPSKRLKSRKKSIEIEKKQIVQLTVEQDGAASSSSNSEFEKASTVDMDDKKIPDISKWTSSDVYNYFVKQGFDKRDSQKLKDQEIDGEALLILNRDDLKDIQFKVGTFVKMWNRIITFQSRSSNFTQGWK